MFMAGAVRRPPGWTSTSDVLVRHALDGDLCPEVVPIEQLHGTDSFTPIAGIEQGAECGLSPQQSSAAELERRCLTGGKGCSAPSDNVPCRVVEPQGDFHR